MRNSSRRLAGTFLLLISLVLAASQLVAPVARAQDVVPLPPNDDWLRYIPGEARFYVEIKDLSGLRERFMRLRIWHTVRELAAREGVPTTRPSDRLPGLSADNAISELIGRRCALCAVDSTQWKDGVLLTELDRIESAQRWLAFWRAARMPDDGPIRRYTLQGGLRMAIKDRLLVLGPANDPQDLWGKTVDLMAGRTGANLRGQSEFASLDARMKMNADGLAYVAWRPGDPFALAGCERMIVGFSVDETELRCETHGQRSGSREELRPIDRSAIEHLPANSIAAFSGSYALNKLADKSKHEIDMEDESLLGLFVNMVGGGAKPAFFNELGPSITVVTGLDAPVRRQDVLRLPSVALVIQSPAPEEVVSQLDGMLAFLGTAIALTSSSSSGDGVMKPLPVENFAVGGIECHTIGIGGPLSKQIGLPFLSGLAPAWAAVPGNVMVATTPDELRKVLEVRNGEAKSLAIDGGWNEKGGEISEWAFVRGYEVSQMLLSWLSFVRRHHPAAIQDKWWQSWALERARARTRLGLGLRDIPGKPGVVEVAELEESSPAAGLLKLNDRIVAASGSPLPVKDAAREIARRYQNRGGSREFEVGVEREGRRESIRIPVEPLPTSTIGALEPIRALRHIIMLLSRIDVIQYERVGVSPNKVDLRIRVKWREDGPKDRR